MQRPGLTRVRIFHQLDPAGLIPGGLPTFIRGLIKAAPDDIQFSVVGLTTNPVERPVGRWTTLDLDWGRVAFFPVGRDRNPGGRSRIPLAVRLAAGIARYGRACTSDCDILEFHRFEPALLLVRDRRPKTAFVHQNMDVIRNAKSDIKWRHLPGLYFALERHVIPAFDSVFCVREDAAEAYRRAFPHRAGRFHFIPTWMDPDVFRPVSRERKAALRASLGAALGFAPEQDLLLSVGRLDQQKDPLLLVESFALVHQARNTARLVIVGDGVLRTALVERVTALGLQDQVRFAGLRTPHEVAELLQIADAFLLTSVYEGMPMAVLEALACGIPVVSTNVGEVARVVHQDTTGYLVDERSPGAVARGILAILEAGAAVYADRCVAAVAAYTPAKVLVAVYQNYRRLLATRSDARGAP